MPKLLKKTLLIIGFVLFYFLGIREVRGVIHDAHYGSILPSQQGVISSELYFEAQSSVSFTFRETYLEHGYGWQYKIPFGSFFLFATIGLLMIEVSKREYGILVLIHLFGGIISFLFVLMGLHVWVKFMIIPDLLSRYLLPLSSMGYVALMYLQQRSKVSYEE
ncbi:MAG: hypothetical protein BalsKO_20140 [Balneolaceae bacterium]